MTLMTRSICEIFSRFIAPLEAPQLCRVSYMVIKRSSLTTSFTLFAILLPIPFLRHFHAAPSYANPPSSSFSFFVAGGNDSRGGSRSRVNFRNLSWFITAWNIGCSSEGGEPGAFTGHGTVCFLPRPSGFVVVYHRGSNVAATTAAAVIAGISWC